MFKANHLITYRGYYYFFIRIPSDLKHLFPCTFIKKSLKTRNEAEAREQVIPLEHKVLRCFRLLRSGLLADDQVTDLILELWPCKTKEKKPVAFKLSDMISRYVDHHEKAWAPKTRLENKGSFKLIQEILGDMELKVINKQVVLDFRNTLVSLPPNMYKLYPDKTIKQILSMDGITPMSTTSANKHLTAREPASPATSHHRLQVGTITPHYLPPYQGVRLNRDPFLTKLPLVQLANPYPNLPH